MNCPACPDTTLVLADRQGIEIDYCPSCRGVWLDRGELDKLVERLAPSRPSEVDTDDGTRARDDDDEYEYEGKARSLPGRRKSRRGSLLGELFDFG